MALAHDRKGRVKRKWESMRRRFGETPSKGLTGEALERAVMAIAAADPSLVKIEHAGAS